MASGERKLAADLRERRLPRARVPPRSRGASGAERGKADRAGQDRAQRAQRGEARTAGQGGAERAR
ncbi:hypothetical protein Ssi03_13200 [Sphaerisporangium siamense]|nr:hypothetical protein Ssi03_13200 [Sphaerisporangium siamense]